MDIEHKFCEVDALRITPRKNANIVYFKCPFCPKHVEHLHGILDEEYKQGFLIRSPNCLIGENPNTKSFKINITNNTKIPSAYSKHR